MKKAIFGIMAILTIFAMVSCGGGSSSSTYTVTFDADGGTPAKQEVKGIASGATIPTAPTVPTKGTDTFGGWYTARNGGGSEFTFGASGTPVTANITVYAKWTAGSPIADTDWRVTFLKNDGSGGTWTTKDVTKGESIGEGWVSVGQPTRTGFDFVNWNTAADGSGSVFNAATLVNGNINVYAIWQADLSRAELVTLDNAWYAVYSFVLPEGKYWDDYKGFKASYLINAADLAEAPSRGARLMGPYQALDFTYYQGTDDAEGKDFFVANYNGGKNAQFILDNKRGASPWGGSERGSLLRDLAVTDPGVNVVGGEWFTLEYTIDGTQKHSGFDMVNMPAEGAIGPFYFGVGLPGQDPDGQDLIGTVQYIRDVTLVGYEEEDNVVGTPTWFKKTIDGEEVTLPAFTGYNTPNGTNGYKEAERDEAKKVVVDIDPQDITVTFNLNGGTGGAAPTPATAQSYTALGDALPTALTGITPPTTGYAFTGWSTRADGKGTKITATSQLVGNITIYAVWSPPVTISFDLNGKSGTAPVPVTIGYGETLDTSYPTVTAAGFVFLGWNTNTAGTGSVVTKDTVLTADATLYAKWIAKATTDLDLTGFAVTLDSAGSATNTLAVLTDKTVTIQDAYLFNEADPPVLTRQSGADNIRFGVGTFPADWQGYEKLVIDYTLTFADSDAHPETGTGNQLKTQIFYGKNSTATAINYFDLDGDNDPKLEFDLATFPDTADGISIKTNPYGFGTGKSMQGKITITINSVTFVAYTD